MIALEASQSLAPEDRDPRHGLIASQYFKFTSTLHSLGISHVVIYFSSQINQLYLAFLDLFSLLVCFSHSCGQKANDVTSCRIIPISYYGVCLQKMF